jgi:hypothetical protein
VGEGGRRRISCSCVVSPPCLLGGICQKQAAFGLTGEKCRELCQSGFHSHSEHLLKSQTMSRRGVITAPVLGSSWKEGQPSSSAPTHWPCSPWLAKGVLLIWAGTPPHTEDPTGMEKHHGGTNPHRTWATCSQPISASGTWTRNEPKLPGEAPGQDQSVVPGVCGSQNLLGRGLGVFVSLEERSESSHLPGYQWWRPLAFGKFTITHSPVLLSLMLL